MRIGDVTVYALPDGVMPMPPGVLYPDLRMSTWRNLPGTIDQDDLLQVPFGGFWPPTRNAITSSSIWAAAVAYPHWRCGFDWDAEAAAATRAEWVDRLRATHTLLIGPHFPDFEAVTL
jgi:hypothetical protein